MADTPYNPWAVTCIDSFNFLCCPECVYRSKDESAFEAHAVQNHPKSLGFFEPVPKRITDTKDDLYFCCPGCNYKSKDVNTFQIHALESHPASMKFFSRSRGRLLFIRTNWFVMFSTFHG